MYNIYIFEIFDGIENIYIEQFHSEDTRNSSIVRVKLYGANKETAISINFSFSNAQ